MRTKQLLTKMLFLLAVMLMGAGTAWATTTYKLTKATSVEAGGLYVFEQSGHVMDNTVSNSALNTTATYCTTGLSGTESYVWTLETATDGFYLKNVSLSSNSYLNNASSTNVSFGSKSSIWTFAFTDGIALISNKSNSNRFLGYTNSTSYAYKAYATSNLSSYAHAITVYKLEEESDMTDSDLALADAPVELSFDLFNNSSAQVVAFTTSSTGAVTVSESEYIDCVVNANTITVTPLKVTPSAQTITISQAADDTYRAGSATFTVSIDDSTPIPTHTVTFSVNGTATTQDFEEGAAITFPTNPADVEGKTFVGWTESAITGVIDDAPTFVTSATMGTEALTFYAVFADKTPGNQTVETDELTSAAINQATYSNWSGLTLTSSAVYAGNSTTGTNNALGAIQIRSKDNSGIVTTSTGGKVTKVSVVWNSATTSGRKLDIYGKGKAYSAASDLYAESTQGTKIGSIVEGTSTELIIDDEYAYVGLRSNDGAMYLDKISIEWTTGTPDTYSSYCTTVVPDTRTAVNMLSFTTATTTLLKNEVYATTVTNDQSGWTAAYTYASDNTDVADVDEDGNIYAYAKGTANITATLNVAKDDATYKAGETRSMSIAVTVENPKHNVKFYNNGEEITASAAEVEEDEAIVFPATPSAPFSSFEFIGWATAAIDGIATDAPNIVTAATMGTTDVEYYAVYGDVQSKKVTATFDASNISNLTESEIYERCWVENDTKIELYLSAGSRYTNGTPNTWSVTKGTNNYFNIEIPSGRLTSIVVTIDKEKNSNYVINSVTEGATVSAYDEASETQTVTVNENLRSVNCYATSNYQIRASKIDVNAVAYEVFGYVTTIPSTVAVKVGDAKYATYCSPRSLDFTNVEGLTAYKATISSDNKVSFEKVEKVPANEGVLLKGNAATYNVPIIESASAIENAFIGVTEQKTITTDPDNGIFVLMNPTGGKGVGFYKTTGSSFTLSANTAYLPALSSTARTFIALDEATAINGIAAEKTSNGEIYNLQGLRVTKAQKGLYIVNGRLQVVK